MKKLISILALFAFTFGMAQETPKKEDCKGKDKKECKNKAECKDKKDCKDKKACDMKGKSADAHKECKMDAKTKKACCATEKKEA